MRRRTICLILVLFILAIGVGTIILIGVSSSHPSDSVLIKKFIEHEADFNLLVKMANDDSRASSIRLYYVRMENKGAWPPYIYLHESEAWPRSEAELGFFNQRWDEYRGLFKKLNLDGIDRKHEMSDAIFFTASMIFSPLDGDGDETEVTEKGYVYSAIGIYNSLTGSLDGVKINRPAIFFKKLNDRDHWYLFYKWSVSKPE
ncbi:MAG TPA: hypothetical protein VJ810_15045 [Blastocatellia bacterium]|nr:hypothetical protein [Blastocatellia bacterium]